eukprot:g57443.t1
MSTHPASDTHTLAQNRKRATYSATIAANQRNICVNPRSIFVCETEVAAGFFAVATLIIYSEAQYPDSDMQLLLFLPLQMIIR